MVSRELRRVGQKTLSAIQTVCMDGKNLSSPYDYYSIRYLINSNGTDK